MKKLGKKSIIGALCLLTALVVGGFKLRKHKRKNSMKDLRTD